MRFLVLGAHGQLGALLPASLEQFGTTTALSRAECNLTSLRQIKSAVDRTKPDIIVNAAAYTDVDRAEREPERAFSVNRDGVTHLAQVAAEAGCGLLHISTDYVFGGSGMMPWKESDSAIPLNVYGKSKLAGEQSALQVMSRAGASCWIIRTSWVYAAGRQNFLTKILNLAMEKPNLQIIYDQVGAPTSALWLACVIADFLDSRPESGIFHLAPAGKTNWYEYASIVIDVAREKGFQVLPDSAIQAVSSAQFPQEARRPANSLLDCSKIEVALELDRPHWMENVKKTVVDHLDGMIV